MTSLIKRPSSVNRSLTLTPSPRATQCAYLAVNSLISSRSSTSWRRCSNVFMVRSCQRCETVRLLCRLASAKSRRQGDVVRWPASLFERLDFVLNSLAECEQQPVAAQYPLVAASLEADRAFQDRTVVGALGVMFLQD